MRKYARVFALILKIIPRYDFQIAVKHYGATRHCKEFSSWSQFVALLYCQIAAHDGLRGVEAGLAAHTSRLYHLGVRRAMRSTLASANHH